jgi:hypothetical protein
MTLQVTPIHAAAENCFTYLATDPRTRCCAVINPLPGTIDAVNAAIDAGGLICEWVLGTGHDSKASLAARALTERHICARTAGPDGAGYQLSLADDHCVRVGHVHGRVVLQEGHASYVFDGKIFSGCCVTAHVTVGRADPLHRLQDDFSVLLHQPVEETAPMDSYQRSLGELRNSPPVII